MPIKLPVVTEMDIHRARHVVSSLAPLRGLAADDAEIIARAIALSYAEGRQRGLDIAKDWTADDWQQFRKQCGNEPAGAARDPRE
jgi:hypothetical protein